MHTRAAKSLIPDHPRSENISFLFPSGRFAAPEEGDEGDWEPNPPLFDAKNISLECTSRNPSGRLLIRALSVNSGYYKVHISQIWTDCTFWHSEVQYILVHKYRERTVLLAPEKGRETFFLSRGDFYPRECDDEISQSPKKESHRRKVEALSCLPHREKSSPKVPFETLSEEKASNQVQPLHFSTGKKGKFPFLGKRFQRLKKHPLPSKKGKRKPHPTLEGSALQLNPLSKWKNMDFLSLLQCI